jgi:hypothetical protein
LRLALVAVAASAGLIACDGEFRFDEHGARDGGAGDVADVDGGGPPARPPCTDDATCGGAKCDVASGVCVTCLADADCSGALPRCDAILHVCVECRELADCGNVLERRCEPTTHRCIDSCFDDDDACPGAGFVCSSERRACIECKSSANCAGSPAGAYCDRDVGRCVECSSNAQCPTEKPVCDRRSGRCAACVSSTACGSGRLCDPVSLVCRDP